MENDRSNTAAARIFSRSCSFDSRFCGSARKMELLFIGHHLRTRYYSASPNLDPMAGLFFAYRFGIQRAWKSLEGRTRGALPADTDSKEETTARSATRGS